MGLFIWQCILKTPPKMLCCRHQKTLWVDVQGLDRGCLYHYNSRNSDSRISPPPHDLPTQPWVHLFLCPVQNPWALLITILFTFTQLLGISLSLSHSPGRSLIWHTTQHPPSPYLPPNCWSHWRNCHTQGSVHILNKWSPISKWRSK